MLNDDQRRIHDDALNNLFAGYKQVYEYGGAAGTGRTQQQTKTYAEMDENAKRLNRNKVSLRKDD